MEKAVLASLIEVQEELLHYPQGQSYCKMLKLSPGSELLQNVKAVKSHSF